MTMQAPTRSRTASPAPARPKQKRVIRSSSVRARELFNQFGSNLYREAYNQGMSLSMFLEHEDPSTPAELAEGMDTFNRVLREAGIRVRTIPEWGVYADRFEIFEESAQTRALVPEWVCRQWRRASTGGATPDRAIYATPDMPLNTALNPYQDFYRPRRTLAPAIPLDRLVAVTTPIDGDAYRAFYLETDAAESRMVRVPETTEVPRAKLTSGEYVIRLHKYGRALEASYESLRRMSIDRIAFHVERLAVQAQIDKVAAVIDVIVNGDGNSNTAAQVYGLTSLDGDATVGELTLKGWLAYKMKFTNPYVITTILTQEGVALQLMLLNVGSANIPLVSLQDQSGFGSFRPINPGLADAVALGWTSDAPSSQIVGFDDRLAVERVVEVGSNIEEVDRWITKQTQILVMTEVEGWACLDIDAAKILDLSA